MNDGTWAEAFNKAEVYNLYDIAQATHQKQNANPSSFLTEFSYLTIRNLVFALQFFWLHAQSLASSKAYYILLD